MFRIKHRGKYLMRNGKVASVHGKDPDPNPYPWYGEVPDHEERDGWDERGLSWHSREFDLISKP